MASIKQQPERVQRLQENADLFRQLAVKAGLDIGPSRGTPIIPIIIGATDSAIVLADKLFSRGISVHPIFYPTVPQGEARLRFFISSLHSEADIEYTVNTIKKTLDEITE